jgi:hypothetical protein
MTDYHSDLPLWQRLGENNISDRDLIREIGEIPSLVKVIRRKPDRPPNDAATYEEANWAKLSPAFRAAHNRRLKARGLSPLPEPEVDLYVPPQAAIRPFDPGDREVVAAVRGFMGPTMMGGIRGGEGFTINGERVGDAMPIRSRGVPKMMEVPRSPPPLQEGESGEADVLFPGATFPGQGDTQGFSINGVRVSSKSPQKGAVRRG